MQNINFSVSVFHNNKNVKRRLTMPLTASSNSSNKNAEFSFALLKKELVSLFKFENLDDWTVQYKDDEGQWVTVSSDEELAFAAKLMSFKLHLQLVSKTTQQQNHHERGINRACGSDNNVRETAKQRGKKQHKEGKQETDKPTKKDRLVQKRSRITEKLSSLQASESPKVAQMEKLTQKLAAINTKLESLPKNGEEIAKLEEHVVSLPKQGEAVDKANKSEDKFLERKNALLKKREAPSERISSLRSSDNPKAQSKLEKLEERAKAIDAKLQKFQSNPISNVVEINKLAVATDNSAEIVPINSDIVPINRSALKEARMKQKTLHLELRQYKSHISSLAKFLRNLQKNSQKENNNNLLLQTEAFLGLLRETLTTKTVQMNEQTGVLKLLVKAHSKKHNRKDNSKNNRKDNNQKERKNSKVNKQKGKSTKPSKKHH